MSDDYDRIPENVELLEGADTCVGLPKWPAMVVSGSPVTEKQAAEIIMRTDYHFPDFHWAGNDNELRRELNGIFGVPDWDEEEEKIPYPGEDASQEEREAYSKAFRDRWYSKDKFRERFGVLPLGYLHNAWIVSSWIGGPHGWCTWDGSIGCNTHNIGKWPSVIDVAREWGLIAETFPYLKLSCVLFNGEECEEHIQPVVQYKVRDGKVEVTSDMALVKQALDDNLMMRPGAGSDLGQHLLNIVTSSSRYRECGIPPERLKEKVELVWGEIPRFERLEQPIEDDSED